MTSKVRFRLDDFKQIAKASPAQVDITLYFEVWSIIQDLKGNKIMNFKPSLSNYVIIRLVSILENYFVNRIQKMIDEEGFEPKGIFQNDEITISILELKEIKSDGDVTTGKIVSNKLSFQRPDDINFVLSNLLGYNYFERVNKVRYSYTFPNDVNSVDFNLKEFHELFSLRHQIVHELNSKTEIDSNKLSRLLGQTLLFIIISQNLIQESLDVKSSKKS